MTYKITWEESGVYVKFTGLVTWNEVSESDSKVCSDPRLDDAEYYIWDGSAIGIFNMSKDDAISTAATDRLDTSYTQELSIALVAKDDGMREVLERYIEASRRMGSPWRYRLFDKVNDARNWACP